MRMKELQCDFVGFSETCVNWYKKKMKKLFQATINKIYKNASLIESEIEEAYNKEYLPGGTLHKTLNKWNSYITGQINDMAKLARWSGATYRLSPTKQLHMISAYRPCKTKITEKNSMASYTQQYYKLLQEGYLDPEPRRQFVTDLISQIQLLSKSEDDYIIVALDANEAMYSKKNGLQKIMKECQLFDMYRTLHEDKEEFPTHVNGTQCIDYLLCSYNVLQYINKCGYIPFHEGYDSDHRGIFCDISPDIFKTHIPEKIEKVRLVGSNSTVKESENYITYLYDQFIHHRIFDKIHNLYNETLVEKNDDEKADIMKKLNTLDKIITDAMLRSEIKHCSKKDPTMYSPILKQSNLEVQYWNIMQKAIRQQIFPIIRFANISDQMDNNTKDRLITNETSATGALEKSIKKHNQLVKDGLIHRKEYLDNKLEDEQQKNGKENLTLKTLIHREETRKNFSAIRKIFKERKGKGLISIDVPDEANPGTMRTIAEPAEMVCRILTRNIQHFAQAQGTPFTETELQEIFGYSGTTEAAQALINNGEIPEGLMMQPEAVMSIINQLGSGKINEINKEVTYEEFENGIHKWKESTTTSPSGRHLGHYKVLLSVSVKDVHQPTINISTKIMQVYYKVALATANLGKSLERWCLIATCMIEKTPGVARIDKLRVIHLYEADYNLLLKIIWARKLVWNAEKYQCLHDGQAGS
jgi:hypothetical protein